MHEAYSTSHWHELSWERFFFQGLFSAGNTLTKAAMNTIVLHHIRVVMKPLSRLLSTSTTAEHQPSTQQERSLVDALHQRGNRGSPNRCPGVLTRQPLLLCRRLTHSEAQRVPQGSFTLGLGPPAGWECHRKMGGICGVQHAAFKQHQSN